ncbi:alpha/beta fold hydrolase [Streptomyces phaeochromogenes]|uniref:alpha/beta fold hydrolase n=1 Tax=Streptomyces phaeochromogenes TaxID=1923 RepID=UPI0036B6D71B
MNQVTTTLLELGGGLAPNPVMAHGDGSPLVYLHGPFGQEWSGYLDDLAARRRVYAPANPGADDPADLRLLDHLWDLVLYYDELLDRLGLGTIDLVGHSYGGMVAAEYAAAYPARVRRLVLIDAMGLWRDDAPVNEFVTVAPETLDSQLWHDRTESAVAAFRAVPEDVEESHARLLRRFGAVASTAHFSYPIPERGLVKRLRRITADTLLIWGADDGLVPPVYAEEFARRLPSATCEIVAAAGHYPHVEQRERVARRTLEFLA